MAQIEDLIKLLENESGSGIKYCEACNTPFMPRIKTQRFCGSAECKKVRDRKYSKAYREEKMTHDKHNEYARQARLRYKSKRQFLNHLDEWEERINKQKEFDRIIEEHGLNYGAWQKQKTLELVPKIDVSLENFKKEK